MSLRGHDEQVTENHIPLGLPGDGRFFPGGGFAWAGDLSDFWSMGVKRKINELGGRIDPDAVRAMIAEKVPTWTDEMSQTLDRLLGAA